MPDYEQSVFISYAWGGEREDIVNEIDETLQQRGIRIVRDKRALGYRGSIKDFMERIGRGSCVIVVISDKYLRSPNCMFELVEIAENKQFYDRVFPVVLSDANIYDPLKRIEYIRFWEGKRKELAKAMKTLDPANLQGIREEMDQYDRIRDKISGITSILKDMNTLTPDMHRDSEFSNLYDAIIERLKEGTTDVTAEFNDIAKKAEAERLAAQKAEEERIARAEANRLAARKAEEERLAIARVEEERLAKEEADQLAAQKAEEEQLAKADREAKAEAERLAAQKAEAERIAKQKVEADLLAAQKAERERIERERAEQERLALAKIEVERKAKQDADRLAAQKAEAERLAKQKAETDRRAKEEADRLAVQKAEAYRLAKQKAEEERLAKARADREAKAEAERKAKERAKPVEAVPAEIKAESVSVVPAERKANSKVMMYGIAAVVVFVIAGIAFTALSNRGTPAAAPLVSASATKANLTNPPKPSNTPKPTFTPTPIPNFVILDASDTSKLYANGGLDVIYATASEQHSDPELQAFFDKNQPIPVKLGNSVPISISDGWCATTEAVLMDNFKYIEIAVLIDGEHVPENKFAEIRSTETDDNGTQLECLRKLVAVNMWASGEHTVRQEFNFTQSINDGLDDYSPQNSTTDYVVTVP